MKVTLIALVLMVGTWACDAGEDVPDCWPGPGVCWFESEEFMSHGICCLDDGAVAVATHVKDGEMILAPPFTPECIPGFESEYYACDLACNCEHSPGGVYVDLPR